MTKKKVIIALLCSITALGLVLCALMYYGAIHINNPSRIKYPVRGVDVSAYQGGIDWQVLSSQNIDFAYIKATEGSSYIDPYFEKNWEQSRNTDLRIGAYHFFSFESPGATQAENFEKVVKPFEDMLPPVIDVEYYGALRSSEAIDVEEVRKELRSMVDELYGYYGVKPVIYVSEETYTTIVNGFFDDCDLWYRCVYSKVPDNVNWTFWQFSNRHRLHGYKGKEVYIDVNVFKGTEEDFIGYRGYKE